MSFYAEIAFIFLSALTLAIIELTTMDFASTIVFCGLLALHIFLYVLSINKSFENTNVNNYIQKLTITLLSVPKLMRNLILTTLEFCLMMLLVDVFNEYIYETNGFIVIIFSFLGFLLYEGICVLIIFISNKLDSTSFDNFTNKNMIPIIIFNIISSYLMFTIIQACLVYCWPEIFIEIPILNKLFEKGIPINFIINLLAIG